MPQLARRKLLKLGGAAAATPLLAGAAQDAAAPVPAPPEPAAIANVVDPAAITAENWSEPWVWRPAEWADRKLKRRFPGEVAKRLLHPETTH